MKFGKMSWQYGYVDLMLLWGPLIRGVLLSLWLGGRAEKIGYEFEDICPHGSEGRLPIGNYSIEHEYHEKRCEYHFIVLGFLNAEIVAAGNIFIWWSFCSCH
jgi:hypothetical protein